MAVQSKPIWLTTFEMLIGLKEIPGSQNDPVIMHWVKILGAPDWYDNDDKPWCALAMNAVLYGCQQTLSGVGFALLRAASFLTYGGALGGEPALGCIMVFQRPEGHHVGLYVGERKDAYYILGANQSNRVGYAWIPKNRLVAQRWPTGSTIPAPRRIWMTADGSPVSVDES